MTEVYQFSQIGAQNISFCCWNELHIIIISNVYNRLMNNIFFHWKGQQIMHSHNNVLEWIFRFSERNITSMVEHINLQLLENQWLQTLTLEFKYLMLLFVACILWPPAAKPVVSTTTRHRTRTPHKERKHLHENVYHREHYKLSPPDPTWWKARSTTHTAYQVNLTTLPSQQMYVIAAWNKRGSRN